MELEDLYDKNFNKLNKTIRRRSSCCSENKVVGRQYI